MKKTKNKKSLPQLLNESKEAKWIPGFEGLYKISKEGIVYSMPRVCNMRIGLTRFTQLRQLSIIIRRGYCYVHLSKNAISKWLLLHRLVAKTYHPLSEFLGAQVNHIDGDKNNNNYLNLEWCTATHNIRHAFKTGLKKAKGNNPKAIIQLSVNSEVIKEWPSIKSITDNLGFDRSPIIKVAKGKQFTSYGFKWEYA